MSPLLAPEAIASHHYFDHDFDMAAVKLMPMQYFVTDKEMALTTVLGSCVAACLHDRVAGVGGMNHFMLPDEGNHGVSDDLLKEHVISIDGRKSKQDMRYGTYAMEVLLQQLERAGAHCDRLEAKVFGGGAVLENRGTLNIGDRNAEFILRFLRLKNISVVAQNLGGQLPRRVTYFPKTGVAMMRVLHRKDD
ncbi:MAG: chemoreceptor glutamine deamidase CheD [Glaciimonas sp.]|nr:chemoreceptor glutamine deamidase CheD [Glaciimonas sp.]